MLKKNNIIFSLIITIFFLVIAYLTTFRLGIYAFIVCYIAVIIAKARNKRLRVPVIDFFVLTFFVGSFFALIYSYSPRLQYYEFIALHSKWEISQVTKIETTTNQKVVVFDDCLIGDQIKTTLFFTNSNGNFKKEHTFNYFETNILNILKNKSQINLFAKEEISNIVSQNDVYIFKKPNKNVYKEFTQQKIVGNSHSSANFAFAIFALFLYLFFIIKIIFHLRKNISIFLTRYPQKEFVILVLMLLYIVIYSLISFVF